MSLTMTDTAFFEEVGPQEGTSLRVKQAVLVIVGILALTIAAKAKVAMFPSPVPITLGTFAVLTIGASYGARLGLITILGYMLIGALGFDVFASSSSEVNGIAYMLEGSGGYLLGYVLAVLYLGYAARRGYDRSVEGVLWLKSWIVSGERFNADSFGTVWEQTMAWGLTPYLIGDLMKLALAALILPLAWKLVGKARS